MTTYNTRTLAEAIIGTTDKAATRTLRKFLRDELPREEQPGKGGRYALDYNKRELTALTKRFKAWEIAQEEAKAVRAAALEAAKAPKAETPEEPIADNDDTEAESDIEDEALEGPTDEEMAAMLSDEEELVDEA